MSFDSLPSELLYLLVDNYNLNVWSRVCKYMRDVVNSHIDLYLKDLISIYKEKLCYVMDKGDVLITYDKLLPYIDCNKSDSNREDDRLAVSFCLNHIRNNPSLPLAGIIYQRTLLKYLNCRYRQIIYGNPPKELSPNFHKLLKRPYHRSNYHMLESIANYLQLCKESELDMFLKRWRHFIDITINSSQTNIDFKEHLLSISKIILYRGYKVKKRMVVPHKLITGYNELEIIYFSPCFTTSKKTRKIKSYSSFLDSLGLYQCRI